jgi:hypothetical protein
MTANSVRSRLSRRQRRILSIIDAGPADGVFSLGIAHELGVPAARLLVDLTQMEEPALPAHARGAGDGEAVTRGMVGGLDGPCANCGRVSGDHTLWEWEACLGSASVDLPYEPVPGDIADLVRQRFHLAPNTLIADHVVVKAATLEGGPWPVAIHTPALIHEYGIGRPNMAPLPVATVTFLSTSNGMRAYGRLVRDGANGAANRVERAT